MSHFDHVLDRQIVSDHGQKENGEIDRKPYAPQDRAKRGSIAEIGEDISNPHDQEQHRQFIDETLRSGPKFRQQDGHREERKGLDAILMRAQRARAKRVGIERGVARFGIVEAAKPDPLYRCDRQEIKHQRSENAPFGDRHNFPRRAAMHGQYRNSHYLDKDSPTREATGIMTAVVSIKAK